MAQFQSASRSFGLKSITAGGVSWQKAVASVALTLVATAGAAQSSVDVAMLEPAIARAVMTDAVRDHIAREMTVRCRPSSMGEVLAGPRMQCRAGVGVGLDSSLDLIKDAELVGEFDGLPVFLSDARSAYVGHIESRGGDSGKWVPMIVISRGLIASIRALEPDLQRAATVFLLARQKELTKTSWGDAADFSGMQRMSMVEPDLDRAEAAALAASRLVPESRISGVPPEVRAESVRKFFAVARDMRDAAMAPVSESRMVQR